MALPLEARRPFNFAHVLTSLRLILTPIFLFAVEASARHPSVARAGLVIALFLLICASDYYDGPLARALGLSSDLGKVLDNLADITFLLVTLTYLVRSNAAPWWIPTAIALAFAQYTVDSWLLSGRGPAVTLVANPIGHWAGILNYIFTGVLALNAALRQRFLPDLLYHGVLTFWLVYLLLAIGVRFRFFLRTYRASSSLPQS
ncbi:MAG TPA: CDP-alcohol phosphatidyltransferase family protein [Candidatus Binatia bacterium]|nr:CDP-alcohol phosphatidyltransferase family protein [Candidatus Binatia bacterium]